MAGNSNAVRFPCDFPVRMYPERHGGFYHDIFCRVRIDSLKTIVFSVKCGGQGEQYQGFRDVPDGAEVENAVVGISFRRKHKTAALVTMQHTTYKKYIADIDRRFMIRRERPGYRSRGKQCLQGDRKIDQFAEPYFI